MAQPIVKWAGGKTRLLPELVKRLPKQYRTYYEPFFGGGALFFHQAPPRAIISDINVDLFNVYVAVQKNVDFVISTLYRMEQMHSRRHFEQIKAEWNKRRGLTRIYRRAAMFIYLNKTCFNGLWRVNSHGEFNVPMGRYGKNHVICDVDKLRAASKVLERAVVRFGDYWINASGANKGDFVYFDPPYDPVSASANFTSYTSNGFTRDDQVMLATRAKELVHAGAQIMLSNSDTPFIRKLYRSLKVFRLHKVKAPRSINSDPKKRGDVGELIITGGY